MSMLNRLLTYAAAALVATLWVGLSFATPAAAGTIYSWQTQDGGIAYTDNAKSVPERYRDQVKTRTTGRLGHYERYTSQDRTGAQRYAAQLSDRLDRMRYANTQSRHTSATAASESVTLDLGVSGVESSLRVPTGADSDEPIVVERVRVMGAGQIATRHDTVVRQGDRILAIVKGRQEGEMGFLSNVLAEDELYR